MGKDKIVIIGGGISGLTAGIYAEIAGYDAEIYEKNSIVGGECTGWDRKGYHIDNCIHWLMGTTKGTELNKIWNTVGAISDDIEVITSDKMYTSELNGQRITLWKDPERTREELLKLSPEDKEEINKLIDASKLAAKVQIPAQKPTEMMNIIDLVKLYSSMKDTLKIFKMFEGKDTLDLMNSFKHPLIRCLISDFCPKESLAHSFPVSYGNFISGDGGIPRGASRKMALRMGEKFQSLGGKLFTNSSVAKINIAGNKATGITLANGKVIEGDYIIPACDITYTFGHLLSKELMGDMLKEILENRKSYPVYGMLQAAFAVNSSIDALNGDIMCESKQIKCEEWISDRITIKTYAYEPSFAPAGKQILEVLVGLSEENYDYFKELYQDKEKYNHKKEEFGRLILQRVEEEIPEYSGKLELLDLWTPMTYQRYCNAFKGYNQACIITKKSRKNPYPSAYIEGIKNIVLAGQWLTPPGGLPGAAIQGKFAIQRILRRDKKSIKI